MDQLLHEGSPRVLSPHTEGSKSCCKMVKWQVLPPPFLNYKRSHLYLSPVLWNEVQQERFPSCVDPVRATRVTPHPSAHGLLLSQANTTGSSTFCVMLKCRIYFSHYNFHCTLDALWCPRPSVSPVKLKLLHLPIDHDLRYDPFFIRMFRFRDQERGMGVKIYIYLSIYRYQSYAYD